MTHVVIISDTHSDTIKKIGNNLIADIKRADVIIHAGDADNTSFIEELQAISPQQFYAVAGNCDYDSDLPVKLVADIGGLRVGLSHGAGRHENIIDRLGYIFSEDDVDIIIFGHTHRPFNEVIGGIRFFNPGSAVSNRGLSYNTYGVMDVISKDEYNLKIERIEQ